MASKGKLEPKQKERHDRESNPGHLRDRQVYSPLYYRDSVDVGPAVVFEFCLPPTTRRIK